LINPGDMRRFQGVSLSRTDVQRIKDIAVN